MHSQTAIGATVDRNRAFVKTGKFRNEMEQIHALWRSLPGPKHKPRFLDVGCGVGGVRDFFLPLVDYYGFDISEDAVSGCVMPLSIPSDRLWVDNVEDMRPQPVEYDVAVMSHLIEHLHQPERALVNVAAALAPGGKLIVLTPNAWFVNVHRPTNWLRGYEIDPTTVQFYSARKLRRDLTAAGLKVHSCYTFGKTVLGQRERLIALAVKDGAT